MSASRGLGALTGAYLKQSFRSKTALFWNIAFPLVWLFVFGFIFAGGDPARATLLMPGLFTITTISGAFFGVTYLMVNERETGILRRYRVTPVTATTVVLANAIRAVAMLTVSITVQGLVGWLVFRFTIAGSPLALATVILFGALAFVPLGLIVGSTAQDMRAAPAISNLLFFPMVFASGAAVPFWMLPGWVQSLSRLLPATYMVEAMQGVMVRGESLVQLWAPLAVLAVTCAVGAALNSMLFRWESTDPLDRKRLAMVVAGLAVLFLGAALVAPAFRMGPPA